MFEIGGEKKEEKQENTDTYYYYISWDLVDSACGYG